MIERIDALPEGVLGLRATGRVTREDYEDVVEPLLEAARESGQRIRFLFHFPAEFERFTAGAAWEDLKLGLRHMRLFERIAVVADQGWLRGSTRAMAPLVPGKVRVFDGDQLELATRWLAEPAEASAISHRMLVDIGVLVIEPSRPLDADDFDRIAAIVDPWIEERGALQGLVVHTKAFPGWENLSSVVQHLKFVRNHHRNVARVALCADGKLAELLPALGRHFVRAKVRHFGFGELDPAIAWAAGRASAEA